MNVLTQRKSPLGWQAAGASLDRLGEACEGSPCGFDNTQKDCAGQKVCASCEFFRHARVTVRVRHFCALTGEKVCPNAPACAFWPGVKFAEAVL